MERPILVLEPDLFATLLDPYLGRDIVEPFDNLLVPRLEAVRTFHGDDNLRYLTGHILREFVVSTPLEPLFDEEPPEWPVTVAMPYYLRLKEQTLPFATQEAIRKMPDLCPGTARLLACLQLKGEDAWTDAYRTCRMAYLACLLSRSRNGMGWLRKVLRDHVRKEMLHPLALDPIHYSTGLDFGPEREAELLQEDQEWLRNPNVYIRIL